MEGLKMKVTHVILEPNTITHVKLPVKTGSVLVKNFTDGDLLVNIESDDFTENYVKIPAMMGELLTENELKSANKYHFFDELYVNATVGGEIELRCIKM